MKINFKRSMSILAISSVFFFQGCGGGGGASTPTTPPAGNEPVGGTDGKYKYDRVSIAGSSITWGAGYLGESSYVGEVEKYLREDVADTVGPDELPNPNEIINEIMSYQGKLYRYNQNTEISGSIIGDSISIVFASSDVDTVVEMIADGNSLGTYTIKSNENIKPVKRYPDIGVNSFRETDSRSVKEWTLGDNNNENHTYTLKVKEGSLLLNYITNHMYHFQNAGIGGYAASTFLLNGTQTTTQEIRDFNPDLFLFESSTNDAQTWAGENANSTNNWIIENPVDFTIPASDQIQLANPVTVQAGDVVVMGTYNGDIRNLAVGIVKINSTSNIVTLTENAPTDIATKCKIKRITTWENNVKEVISRVTSNVSKSVVVGIGTSGVPNYDPTYTVPYVDEDGVTQNDFVARRLMGYKEKGKILAAENGWMFFDFFGKILEFEPGIDSTSSWSNGDNTHPRNEGYRLFGEAVTDVLKTK